MPKYRFSGIFTASLPKRCFAGDAGDLLVFSNILTDTYFPVVVDLSAAPAAANVHVQRHARNIVVVDVGGSFVVGSHSTRVEPHRLAVGTLSATGKLHKLDIVLADEGPGDSRKEEELVCETIWLTPKAKHPGDNKN